MLKEVIVYCPSAEDWGFLQEAQQTYITEDPKTMAITLCAVVSKKNRNVSEGNCFSLHFISLVCQVEGKKKVRQVPQEQHTLRQALFFSKEAFPRDLIHITQVRIHDFRCRSRPQALGAGFIPRNTCILQGTIVFSFFFVI